MSDRQLQERLKKIKALVLDCDGILSDCRIYYVGEGKWARHYSIRDGFGIKKLQKSGVLVSVITTSVSEDIRERMKSLAIDHWFEGAHEKTAAWESILSKHGLKDEEVAYMGDDDPDLPLLERAGFSATVPEAMENVKGIVNYITQRPGGNGAVREVCEMILKAKELK